MPALAVWVLAALSGHAVAQPEQPQSAPASHAAAPTEAARERAGAHFATAMEHYRARRFREAIHEFRLSLAQVPSAELWFNIARTHEELGEIALAVEHYRLYLRDRVDAPDAPEVQRRIRELERSAPPTAAESRAGDLPGALAIDAVEPGALVLLDGEKLGVSPIERVLRVAPGRHRLEASRPGYVPYRAEIEVQPGALSAAYVELRPMTRAHAVTPERAFTWVAAGTSAGALVASGVLGLLAGSRGDAGERDAAQSLTLASHVALGGGIVLAVSAVLLYFIEGQPDDGLSHERGR